MVGLPLPAACSRVTGSVSRALGDLGPSQRLTISECLGPLLCQWIYVPAASSPAGGLHLWKCPSTPWGVCTCLDQRYRERQVLGLLPCSTRVCRTNTLR
ncbi:hypothetical protein RRG08_022655 [Elysia crispata]|uniref:Uncharacterized protein n=1 Tax=Elysia crispata TaxID=231223 RepID=A0AAE0Z2U6_9GAST|nr:hypothetical protein RRG08_022655 [Elysia crispata]